MSQHHHQHPTPAGGPSPSPHPRGPKSETQRQLESIIETVDSLGKLDIRFDQLLSDQKNTIAMLARSLARLAKDLSASWPHIGKRQWGLRAAMETPKNSAMSLLGSDTFAAFVATDTLGAPAPDVVSDENLRVGAMIDAINALCIEREIHFQISGEGRISMAKTMTEFMEYIIRRLPMGKSPEYYEALGSVLCLATDNKVHFYMPTIGELPADPDHTNIISTKHVRGMEPGVVVSIETPGIYVDGHFIRKAEVTLASE